VLDAKFLSFPLLSAREHRFDSSSCELYYS